MLTECVLQSRVLDWTFTYSSIQFTASQARHPGTHSSGDENSLSAATNISFSSSLTELDFCSAWKGVFYTFPTPLLFIPWVKVQTSRRKILCQGNLNPKDSRLIGQGYQDKRPRVTLAMSPTPSWQAYTNIFGLDNDTEKSFLTLIGLVPGLSRERPLLTYRIQIALLCLDSSSTKQDSLFWSFWGTEQPLRCLCAIATNAVTADSLTSFGYPHAP